MSSQSVAGRRADRRWPARVLTVAVGALIVLPSYGAERRSHAYYCPKYEAGVRFVDQRVLRSYGAEFPAEGFTTYTRSGSSSAELVDCSTKEMLCFEEQIKPLGADSDVFVYAVPREVAVGDKYQVRGVNFRVDRSAEYEGSPRSVIVFAERDGQEPRLRYKMRIEQGRGVTQLHFEKLRGSPPGLGPLSREYTGVSCTLMSKKGLLAGSELNVPALEDVID